jgi:hypothetical protein
MKKVSYFLLSLLISCVAHAQQFPTDFIGSWKGEIDWYQQGKKEPKKVSMQLRIQATDTAGQYTWQIIYGDKETDNRPYVLKSVDTAKGHWAVDERNGIVLDQYWIGNKLSGVFSVSGSTIFNSYWLEKGQLHVEFVSLPVKPLARTGVGTDDSPFVDSYPIKSFQHGVLKRVP